MAECSRALAQHRHATAASELPLDAGDLHTGKCLLVARAPGVPHALEGHPSDGVVPYSSAHIDGTDSELVVPADHFHVHHHPLAILEVRRILLDHLREADRRQPVRQAGK